MSKAVLDREDTAGSERDKAKVHVLEAVDETSKRFLLMEDRREQRAGKVLENPPPGSSQCNWCLYPLFTPAVDETYPPAPELCENCDWLLANGII
ncbi:MAG: hypothetical protein Q8P13_03190 [bacterium]|nr:hypothetical protein [bacterium]